MKVYVVMGNDFPECVFEKETNAVEYCADRKREDAQKRQRQLGLVIHWRVHEFELIR